jgi:hypothetical protein
VNNHTNLASNATVDLAPTSNPSRKSSRILLRSSWQTVNIGDIAHTPGMLALLEKHRPDDEVTLWPNPLSPAVEKLLVHSLSEAPYRQNKG